MDRVRRPLAVLIAGLACIVAVPSLASAKEGARATLVNPAALRGAAPGEHVRLAWEMSAAPALPVVGRPPRRGDRSPFGPLGVYVSLRGRRGGAPRIVAARSPAGPRGGYPAGRYVADVTIPAGGIASLAIGLEGFRYTPGRAPVRADVFFPISNDPFAAATAGDGGSGEGSPPWVLIAAATAALALLVARFRLLTARRTPT